MSRVGRPNSHSTRSCDGRDGSRRTGAAQAPTSYPMEFKTDRPGGDYRDFELPNADPNACAAACARDKDCEGLDLRKARRRR